MGKTETFFEGVLLWIKAFFAGLIMVCGVVVLTYYLCLLLHIQI